MPTRVHVAGQRELINAGEMVADHLQHGMAPAHLEVAAAIVPAIVARTPIDSGALAGSFRAETSRTKAWVTTTIDYAGVQNWGWPEHDIEPHYFMADGARAAETEWMELYTGSVQGYINDSVRRSGADNPPRVF